MKVLLGLTMQHCQDLATIRGMPVKPPPGWQYISVEQGLRPWLGRNPCDVVGVIPTNAAIVYEWWVRGITHEDMPGDEIERTGRRYADSLRKKQEEREAYRRSFAAEWPIFPQGAGLVPIKGIQ